MCQRDSVEGLGQGADLVHLHQQCVGRTAVDAVFEALGVGDEEVVADQLDLVADRFGEGNPAVPVILGQGVLDGDHRELGDQCRVEVGHLGSSVGLALEGVTRSLGVELGGRHVQGQSHIGAELEAGLADGLTDELQSCAGTGHVGGEAALVAQPGGKALGLEHGLEGVVHLGAPAQ